MDSTTTTLLMFCLLVFFLGAFGRGFLPLGLAVFLAFAVLLPLRLSAQTSPEAFLGFKVGADRKLADYGQEFLDCIAAYCQAHALRMDVGSRPG